MAILINWLSQALDAIHNMFTSKISLALGLLFVLRLIFLTIIEKRNPAHEISYREVLPFDIIATLIFYLIVIPTSDFLDRKMLPLPDLPAYVGDFPLALRLLCYMVLADLGHYWIYRFLHAPRLWRAHKWHHYPTYMYWLAGVRGSILQQTLVNVPYIIAGLFLGVTPRWVVWAIILKNIFENDIMHLNVWWGNRLIEWVFVTPRYHHIHHSEDPSHYTRNLATLLTIWDRLFGTYLSPDLIQRNLKFGIGEKIAPARLIVGI